MFPDHEGGPWDQRNALRSFYALQNRVGLKRVGFHRLRHTFATEYLRRGGDVVRLSRTLGHTQITTTMRYLHLLTEDLSADHAKISIVAVARGRECSPEAVDQPLALTPVGPRSRTSLERRCAHDIWRARGAKVTRSGGTRGRKRR